MEKPAPPDVAPATPTRALGAYLVEATALLSAVLFLTGWVYAHTYYGVFGVGLTQLEVEIPHYFVWARRPLFDQWYLSLPMFILALIVMPGYPQMRRSPLFSRIQHRLPAIENQNLLILLGLVLMLVVSPRIAETIGERDGLRDLFAETTHLPAVTVTLKDPEGDARTRARLLTAGIVEGDYYLLGHHKAAYYLVPRRHLSAIGVQPPRVVVIPDEIVAAIQVLEVRDE